MLRNLFFLLYVLFELLSPAFAQTGTNSTAPYRIAVIIPLSGPVASLGQYVRKGIELAYEELDQKAKQSLKISFEDDQFDPKQTISVYQRISSSERLDAVFVVGSVTAIALAPLTERGKQLLISIGGSDPNIVKDRFFTFIHWVIPPVLGKKLSQELLNRKFQRIAVVSAETSGALADADALVEALKALNQEKRIVYYQSFDKGTTDYRSAIEAIRKKKAEATVLVLFPGALSAFTKQSRDLKLNTEIVGMETFEDEAEVKASQGSLIGKWYVNASDPTDQFVTAYKNKWKEHPGWACANGYDTLKLLAKGVQINGTDNTGIQKFLSTLKDYNGAAGIYSASGDNRFTLPATLKRVTEHGFERMQ